MSSSNSRMSAQGPTLPPIRSLQQPAGVADAHRLPTTNRLPPLRRPVQPTHRTTNSLGAPISVSGLAPTVHTSEFNPIHRDIASSMAAQEGLSRSLEKAFNVYNDRLRSDLRDFRGLCTGLVAQEQQEAMKWYSLCLKVMKERDIARQQLHLLSLERSAGSATSPPISPSSADQEAELNKALKRGREDYMMSNSLETASTSSRSSSVEARPTRPLRLSPVHSPSGSPTRMSTSPPPLTDPSTLSSSSTSLALPSSPPANPHGRVDHRPGKRRKSCEAISPTDVSSPRVKEQCRTPSPLSFPGHLRSLPTQQSSDFPHVDLMYVPTNGLLVCRACILHKSKAPSVEPKSFPSTVSWDDLRQHCLRAHPEACADVARLCPAEIFELRRRLSV